MGDALIGTPRVRCQSRSPARRSLSCFFLSTLPNAVYRCGPPPFRRRLATLLAQRSWDTIFIDGLYVAWSLPVLRKDFLIEHWEPSTTPNWVPAYCAVRTTQDMYAEYITGEEELYDLRTDPYELENVADDPSYAALKAKLHARMVQLCSPPPPGFTP